MVSTRFQAGGAGGRHLVTCATAGLIGFARSNDDDGVVMGGRLSVDQALSSTGYVTADDADGTYFVDGFGLGQQDRHWPKGFTAEIHVEAGGDDALAGFGQLLDDMGNFPVKELGFIDPDDRGIGFKQSQHLARCGYRTGLDMESIVGGNALDSVTIVKPRFEDLDLLFGNLSAAQPAEQLFGLAAEHAAADHL
jgi:hypothetical protein